MPFMNNEGPRIHYGCLIPVKRMFLLRTYVYRSTSRITRPYSQENGSSTVSVMMLLTIGGCVLPGTCKH